MATNNAVNVNLSGQSGTGAFAGTVSPSFTTPNIGVASGTSFNSITGLAAQADQEAGTSTVLAVSPGRQQFHPSAAKVWIKWGTVTTTTIAASYNVTSLTDNGTGDTTINFTVAFSSGEYSYTCGCNNSLGFGAGVEQNASAAAPATGSCRFVSFRYTTDAAVDVQGQEVHIFGDQ